MSHASALVSRLRRKLVVVVLALTLVATLAPTAAFAAPAHGPQAAYANRHVPQRQHHDRRPDHGKRCEVTYRVRKGDNLTRIARHFGVSIHSLVRINNIRNPNRIYAGQVLCIR